MENDMVVRQIEVNLNQRLMIEDHVTCPDFISLSLLPSVIMVSLFVISVSQHRLIRMQIRRQTRERRQYVYAKSVEAQERQTFERKRQLKNALASGKALPTELKKDAKDLGRDLAFDEAQAGQSGDRHPGDQY